jgi:hypothetical protein
MWSEIRSRLRSDDPKVVEQAEDDQRKEAYITACERDSPNSPGFDALIESIYEDICDA